MVTQMKVKFDTKDKGVCVVLINKANLEYMQLVHNNLEVLT